MRRMLIVEDALDISHLLQEFFSAKGFHVTSAFSGEEAVAKLQDSCADIILLDILLPGLSGLEVLRHVKAICPETRVVIVTAVDQSEVKETAFKYGADGYITKPFDFSENTWSPVFAQPSGSQS